MAKGAKATARAYRAKNTVQRVGKPRTSGGRSQNAGKRLMVGTTAGFDRTSGGNLGDR